jgi:branched-chain amino acid transport system permease protein
MSTVALSFIIQNITETLIGFDRMPLKPTVEGKIDIANQAIDNQKLFNIGLVVVVIILLEIFFNRTMLGKSVRAVAFNQNAASLMGINVNFVKVFTFGLSGALAAVAGLVLAPVAGGMGPAEPAATFAIQAFAVAIIGGLDNLRGIAVASLVYSVAQQLIQNYISNDLARALTFVLLIVVLAIKPTGIFGRTLVQKV